MIININAFAADTLLSSTGKEVKFDGLLSARPTITNIVTRRPTEDGYDASDAVHNNPTVLDCTIVITDTAQSILDRRAFTSLGNATGTKILKSYTKKQLSRLKAISNNRERVEIKTKYDTYTDYFLENMTYDETADEGLIISFTLSENRTTSETQTQNFDDSIGIFS